MEQQITIEQVYSELKNLELTLQKKKIISKEDLNIKIDDWKGDEKAFADEELLAESWSSPEDEKAFAYLQ